MWVSDIIYDSATRVKPLVLRTRPCGESSPTSGFIPISHSRPYVTYAAGPCASTVIA